MHIATQMPGYVQNPNSGESIGKEYFKVFLLLRGPLKMHSLCPLYVTKHPTIES